MKNIENLNEFNSQDILMQRGFHFLSTFTEKFNILIIGYDCSDLIIEHILEILDNKSNLKSIHITIIDKREELKKDFLEKIQKIYLYINNTTTFHHKKKLVIFDFFTIDITNLHCFLISHFHFIFDNHCFHTLLEQKEQQEYLSFINLYLVPEGIIVLESIGSNSCIDPIIYHKGIKWRRRISIHEIEREAKYYQWKILYLIFREDYRFILDQNTSFPIIQIIAKKENFLEDVSLLKV